MSVRRTMTDHAAIYQVDLYYRTHVEARKITPTLALYAMGRYAVLVTGM